MILTESDVERIALEVAGRTDLRKQLNDLGPWHFEAEDGYLQLHTRPGPPAKGSPGGAPCWFLGDDGRCRIWAVRPEGCRLYPAVWDEGVNETVLDDDYCPHTDGFAINDEVHTATQGLAAKLESELKTRAM
jgi:Fe-S-cluster containining protein